MRTALWHPAHFLVSLEEVDLWNVIVAWSGVPIPLTKTSAVEFVVGAAPDGSRRGHVLRPDAGPDFIAIPLDFPFKAMFGADLDVSDLARLPEVLARNLDEGVIAALWGALPDNRMGNVHIVASGALADLPLDRPREDLQWLTVKLGGLAPAPCVVLIGAPIAAIVRTAVGGAIAPRPVSAALGTKLTTETCFWLGSIRMTIAEARRVKPGDVIVLDARPANIVKMRTGRGAYTFARHDKGWQLVSTDAIGRYRTSTGLSEGTDSMRETEAADLGQLVMAIDFDLGSIMVPLAAIESWQPGAVIPLNPPLATEGVEVTIRANGQIIGSGDLVRIDDRVAVRITRLLHLQKD